MPTITSIKRTSIPPESLVELRGKTFTDIIASSNKTASNGVEAFLRRVSLTSGTCELYEDVDILLVKVVFEVILLNVF